MSSKTQMKSQEKNQPKVKPLYIGLAVLAVAVIVVVILLLTGKGNICTTGVSDQIYVYPSEAESYAVPVETVVQCAGELGVPVSEGGIFPNTVTSGELARVMGEVCKKEGKGVYGIAFGTIRYSVLAFGKGEGKPVELVQLPSGFYTLPLPKDPEAGDLTEDTGSILAAATYMSQDCPKTAIPLSGGARAPPVQLPVSGSQAPTASPAP